MGELKLKGMTAVKDVETTEDVDLIMNFVVTDPLKITHYINFWRGESVNATGDDKIRAEKMVNLWLNYAERQGMFTTSIYSFDDVNETKEIIKNEVRQTVEPTVENTVDQPVHTVEPKDVKLTVVKDNESNIVTPDEDRILRVKYEKIIKKINVEALKQMCVDLVQKGNETDAMEVATFILGKGLYTGKKVKQWSTEKIGNFIESCKHTDSVKVEPTTVETTATETTETKVETVDSTPTTESSSEEVLNDETDLYKKYANFIGEHAPTLASLKVETKLSLKHGEVEKGLELALFMLKEGLCADNTKKWSDLEVEEWVKGIKQELIDSPDNLVVTPTYDVTMKDFYPELRNHIVSTDASEESVKQFVFEALKAKKIENLEHFFGIEAPNEEFEAMYVRLFVSYVAESFKQRDVKNLDVTSEIIKYLKRGIDKGDKAFGSAVQSTMTLFRQRGEKPDLKEVKDLVYNLAKDNFPEAYGIAITILDKAKEATKDAKPVVISSEETSVDFTKKYPEVWESIKDTNPKSLDDVYNMARELEKNQSFLIVSEMIMYLISSGKIENKDGILICEDQNTMWDKAQIELWINAQFTKAPTVDETHPTTTVTEPQAQTVGTEKETVDNVASTEVASEVVPETIVDNTIKVEPVSLVDPTTPGANIVTEPTEKPFSLSSATILGTPGSYKIPEDKVPFTGLYAKSNNDFWHEFANNIIRLEKEGMTKKDIIHTMADTIKAIAINDDLTQCHARNFKKTRIDEMYKVIEAKAAKYEIPGWGDSK